MLKKLISKRLKAIILLLSVFIISCEFYKSEKQIFSQGVLLNNKIIEEQFKCSINFPKSIFPYMYNIDSMRNIRTGKFKPLKIHIGKTKNIKTNTSNFLLEHGEFIGEYNISIRNDSLTIESDSIIHTMGIFKYKYKFLVQSLNTVDTIELNHFSFLDYSVSLDTVSYDEECKDSIYKFKYIYSPPLGVPIELHRDFTFINMFISKKRGVLKVILKERETEDIWEAKYFGNITD